MPGKNGGDGGPRNDVLRVDPDAVPGLRGAFADALTRVDEQLKLVEKELRVTAWAKDPVSLGASTVFNDRALDSDSAAVDMLRAYRDELDAAVQNLDASLEQYQRIEADNAAGTGKNHEG